MKELTENEKQLKEVLNEETPMLFVGHGFVNNIIDEKGRKVSYGDLLKERLITDLLKKSKDSPEFRAIASASLKDVSDYCRSDVGDAKWRRFLEEYFGNLLPFEDQASLFEYPWKKIFTTNIDGLIERCLSEKERNYQILASSFYEKGIDSDEVMVFKLNGSLWPVDGEVSLDPLGRGNSFLPKHDYRFSSLSFEIQSSSFLFVGLTNDDPVIDLLISIYEQTGFRSARGKLFFLMDEPSIIIKSKIEKAGGILLDFSLSELSAFLKEHSQSSSGEAFLKELKSFGFISVSEVTRDAKKEEEHESQLYQGFEPQWSDIYFDYDFINDDVYESAVEFIGSVPESESGIISIVGKGVIGKSTYLLRLGYELSKIGAKVFSFSGKYFNYFKFKQYIDHYEEYTRFVLLIDNGSFLFNEIKLLMDMVKGNQLIVITTSRKDPYHKKRHHFIEMKNFHEILIPGDINDKLARKIVRKLDEKGFLGVLKKYDLEEERVDFIAGENDIVSVFYKITYGSGFVQRITEEFEKILKRNVNDPTRRLVNYLVVFEAIDLPLFPKELITHILKDKSYQAILSLEDLIKQVRDQGIRLRSPIAVPRVIKKLSSDEKVEVIRDILIAIAPHVKEDVRDYWNEIHSASIRLKVLDNKLGIPAKMMKKMLYDLRAYYYNNYNYWLHLGIAEQKDKDYDKALNHFRQAEALSPNSYMVRNAIGRNFLKQSLTQRTKHFASNLFKEGEKILLDFIKHHEEYQARAFASHAYLFEKIQFLKKFRITPHDAEIRKMSNILRKMIQKDPRDEMTKHIRKYFSDYLRTIGRSRDVVDFIEMDQLDIDEERFINEEFDDYYL